MSFFVEGIEDEIWHEYMNGVKNEEAAKEKKNLKIAATQDRDESDYASEDKSDQAASSDEEIELIDYDNEITKNLWLPNEPKLYVIYNGYKFINYNGEHDLLGEAGNDGDSEEGKHSEDEEVLSKIENYRTHSEYMTMR